VSVMPRLGNSCAGRVACCRLVACCD
jgi:hypothetical protein